MTYKRRGFTLIEVMVALTVMATGALGVMAIQRHVVLANRQARRIDIAVQIAETWIERLKIDATEWPLMHARHPRLANYNNGPRDTATLRDTQWLRQITTSPGQFQTIAINTDPVIGTGPNISNAFDFFGQDVAPGAGVVHAYCASFRLSWARWELAPAGGWPRAIRADVRVWWPRERSGVGPATEPFALCTDTDAPLSPGGVDNPNYHFVYLSSVISATNIPL